MSEPIVIRRAQVRDACALAGYMAALSAEPDLDTIRARPATSVRHEQIQIRKALAAERAFILTAWSGRDLIGVLDVWAGEEADVRHAGSLGISVAASWRGQGVGRKLMVRAIEAARAWDGFCRIELEVVTGNARAIGLYESLGFVVEGTRRKALSLGGRLGDLVTMALVW